MREQALPYLRTLFVGGFGMMIFYMLNGALRAAGDAKTGLRLGIVLERQVRTVAVAAETLPVTADTSAAVVGFNLHFQTLEKAALMGLFKRAG